ncbi:unnamed protein product [Citrullus colocynthis]|uniref:Uncharacterized protein n=1 Tax=Citrullus colocynthis TaxID=252529 RepID=A0ABP0Z6V4_9ROSI
MQAYHYSNPTQPFFNQSPPSVSLLRLSILRGRCLSRSLSLNQSPRFRRRRSFVELLFASHSALHAVLG